MPAQNCMNAGKQFAWVERFGQIIVGAHFQPALLVCHVGLGGDKQHRDVARQGVGLEPAADFVAGRGRLWYLQT